MRLDDCFELGHIQKPHGLRGEVSVFLDTDFPEDYNEMGSVFVLDSTGLIPFFIESIHMKGTDRAIVKFEEIDTFEDAKELQSCKLYLPLTVLPDLGEGKFYFHEIIGYSVLDKQHGALGTVSNIYSAGPNELLAVEYQENEILIPLQDEIVLEVNKEKGEIMVDLPDGLLDLYTEES